MVRITGGTHRGQVVHVPLHGDVRPTTGRVREAIFNMLGPRLPEAWVLDLFAGSGLLGLEAMSRGARFAAFVDSNPAVVKTINGNIDKMRLAPDTTVIHGSVINPSTHDHIEKIFNQRQFHGDKQLGIIFMDPPYGFDLVAETLSLLEKSKYAVPGTLAVAEHESGAQLQGASSWEPLQYRRYGDTRISVFQRIRSRE